MLETQQVAPPTLSFPAVVEVWPEEDPNRGQRCRIYHNQGQVDAWTWLGLCSGAHPRTLSGIATTLDISIGGSDFLLLAFSQNADLPLRTILSEAMCPVPGVLKQTSDLIDSLRIFSLRRFVKQALLQPEAISGYWSSPASWRHHHAYPGGCAEHCLEVATMAASVSGLPDEDRELGIVLGLLHDYGKIWCYPQDQQGRVVDPRDHEAYGRKRLQGPLFELELSNPVLAARMHELLGGPRVPRESPYPLAIGRIIRSFDQMSCEKTRLSREPTCAQDAPWNVF